MTIPRQFLRGLQRLAPAAPGGLRVLCYHLVAGGSDSPVDLPRDEFVRQLDDLVRRTRIVHLREGVEQVLAGDAGGCVAITFDDAYRNFVQVVLPLLVDRAIPATLFVPTGFVEGSAPSPISGVDLPPCGWRELREIVGSGAIRVGSHTCTHPDLRHLAPADRAAELRESRARLEDELGVEVDSFCYPRALWNRAIEPAVAAEYDFAVIGGGRRITARTLHRHRLWRTSVRRDAPLPVTQFLARPWWIEETAADIVRRW